MMRLKTHVAKKLKRRRKKEVKKGQKMMKRMKTVSCSRQVYWVAKIDKTRNDETFI